MRNRRKTRSKDPLPGEALRPDDLPRRGQLPWETRSFDAALTSLSQFR